MNSFDEASYMAGYEAGIKGEAIPALEFIKGRVP